MASVVDLGKDPDRKGFLTRPTSLQALMLSARSQLLSLSVT